MTIESIVIGGAPRPPVFSRVFTNRLKFQPCVVPLQQDGRVVQRHRVENQAFGDHGDRAVLDRQFVHRNRCLSLVMELHTLELESP